MAKSIANSVTNSVHIGGNAFAMFLKNQRKWKSPSYTAQEIIDFQANTKRLHYNPLLHILPHGSYLINMANSDDDKRQQAYDSFLDELKRCEVLGIGKYNFHPGSTATSSREDGISHLSRCLNNALSETKSVIIVVECMAGHGNVIGGSFEELASIIEQVTIKDRIGVCLDTCHLFAAGYDFRSESKYQVMMQEFDRIVGNKYLAGMHLNDSKADLAAKKDLHANIGWGYIGLEAFRCIMNDKRLEGLPLILETPSEDENKKEDKSIWAKEIKLLESLIGQAPSDPEFLRKAEQLSQLGKHDRDAARQKAEKKTKSVAQKKARISRKEKKGLGP